MKLSPFRRVPWLMLFEVARMTHGHVMDATSPADRRKVMALVKRTKGDPRKLTAADRAELKRIAAKLDLKQIALGMAPRMLRGKR
jgi:hypothetical protein